MLVMEDSTQFDEISENSNVKDLLDIHTNSSISIWFIIKLKETYSSFTVYSKSDS